MNTDCVMKKNPVHSCPVWPSAPLLSCFICPLLLLPPGAALHRAPEDIQQLPPTGAVRPQRASAYLRRSHVWTDPAPVQHRHAAGQQDLPEQTQHGHEVHLLRRQVGARTRAVGFAGPRTRVKQEEGKLIKGDCISVSLVFYQLIFLKN